MKTPAVLPRRILIVNAFGIGDVLFTTPLIQNIRDNISGVFIGFLANQRTAGFLVNNCGLDRVHVYERDDWVKAYRGSKRIFWRRLTAFLAEIRDNRYDLMLDLSLNGYSSLWMWLAGIPRRVGFNYQNRSRFLTQKIPLSGYEGKHVADFYLELGKAIGLEIRSRRLSCGVLDADRQWAEKLGGDNGDKPRPRVALFPGGGASWGRDSGAKRWPVRKFAELADKTVEKFGADVILLGDETEKELCLETQKAMRRSVRQACGETSLGQTLALLSQCSLVVVNDGGPLHLGVAAGVPTVAIFGPVDENVYGPFPGDGHQVVSAPVPCRPCYRRFRRAQCDHLSCLRQISVDDVFEKVQRSLAASISTRAMRDAYPSSQ